MILRLISVINLIILLVVLAWAFIIPSSASASTITNEISTASNVSISTFAEVECSDQDCLFHKYINPLIKVLAAVVGVLVVLMIIVGGIQYSSAGSDPQKVSAAKNKITNALLGLVVYIFLFGLLQWLMPGGLV